MAGNPFQHERARIDRGRTLVDTDNEARTLAITPEGYLTTVSAGVIGTESVVNSTVTSLNAGETFTGDWELIRDYALIKIFISSDQDSLEYGLVFQQSPDQVFIGDDSYNYIGGTEKLYAINPVAKYFRIKFTNGSSDQTEFVIQTIYSSVYSKPTTHRIGDTVTGDDDTELVTSILKVKTNDDETYKNIDAQNPLPTDGDSVYGKDLYLQECDTGGFIITSNPTANQTEILTSMVSDVWLEKKDDSVTNPKIVTLAFRRPILTTSFGIDAGPSGDFSNVKIYIKQGQEEFLIVDESSDNTKYKINLFSTAPLKFSQMRIEFHTSDTITTGLYGIFKHIEVAARLQALKPDGSITDIEATAGSNLKISMEELESGISVNNNSQLRTTRFNSDGVEKDIDLNGLDLSRDFFTEVKLGNVPGYSLIHKFGRNDVIGTTSSVVAIGGVYPTPMVNTALEVVSTSTSDAVGGGGATKVMVFGLVETAGIWSAQSEEVTLTGTTPSPLANDYIRIFRSYISETEGYASPTSVSGVGTLTIQEAGAGAAWLVIGLFTTGNSAGQSQVAMYTTPSASKGILFTPHFTIDSTKVANITMFLRPNADDVITPFTGARRMIHQWDGLDAPGGGNFFKPYSSFVGATDFGVMASVGVGTGTVSAEFWILEIAT